jgi:hypothetical protein
MTKHREITISGWRYPVVLGLMTVIMLLATLGAIVLVYAAVLSWDRIAGNVRMTW